MCHVKTFIASSTVEFCKDRVRLGNYIRSLDSRFTEYGYHFQVILCEDLSPALENSGKQAIINDRIRDCQFFYVLVGRDLGEYTEREFEVALAEYKAHSTPRIYTYFRKLGDSVQSDTLIRFKQRLKDIGHYRRDFVELSELERDITIELMEYVVQNAPKKMFLEKSIILSIPLNMQQSEFGFDEIWQRSDVKKQWLLDGIRNRWTQIMKKVSSVKES